MHATSGTVMYICETARNSHSPLASSHHVRSTLTAESTPAMDASFTTRVLHTGCDADRWNRFLSSVSPAAEPSARNPDSDAATVARWWREHSRVWGKRVIAS
jgi:hypothetical protein